MFISKAILIAIEDAKLFGEWLSPFEVNI
jgi:hypothetical protein